MRSEDKRWRLWHRYTTKGLTELGLPYLDRLYIFECPLGSVFVQKIGGPDPSTDYHNHPWKWFFSFILRGRYVEAFPGKTFWDPHRQEIHMRKRTWWNFKTHKDFHVVLETFEKPVWTLLFCGPRMQEWGFLVDGTWVHFKEHEGSS